MDEPSFIRKTMRAKREALSSSFISNAEQSITTRLFDQPHFISATHVAFYHAIHKEVPTANMIERAHQLGKHIALPAIHDDGRLTFHSYHPGDQLVTNTFGVMEPQQGEAIASESLSLVIVPGLAFCQHSKHRLGYGKGYYDKSFDFLPLARKTQQHHVPLLIGLAYDFQVTTDWQANAHDIAVDFILTEKTIY